MLFYAIARMASSGQDHEFEGHQTWQHARSAASGATPTHTYACVIQAQTGILQTKIRSPRGHDSV